MDIDMTPSNTNHNKSEQLLAGDWYDSLGWMTVLSAALLLSSSCTDHEPQQSISDKYEQAHNDLYFQVLAI